MSDDRTRPTTENDTVILFARDSGEVVVVPEEAPTSAGAGTTSAEGGAVDAPTEEASPVSGSEETAILDADEPASETEVLEQAEPATRVMPTDSTPTETTPLPVNLETERPAAETEVLEQAEPATRVMPTDSTPTETTPMPVTPDEPANGGGIPTRTSVSDLLSDEDTVTPAVTEEPATEQLDTHGSGDGATGSAASASTATSAATPPPPATPAWNTPGYVTFEEEAPRRGVRVGQLLWGGLVMVLGIFLIAFGLLPDIDVPLTLIGLLGLLGVGFVVGAIASGLAGRSKRRRR